VDRVVQLQFGYLGYAHLHTSCPIVLHRGEVGKTLEKHRQDKDGAVLTLMCNSGNLPKVFNGVVVCCRAGLEVEGGFKEAESVDPRDMFIPGVRRVRNAR
jgi:hypothetical protein